MLTEVLGLEPATLRFLTSAKARLNKILQLRKKLHLAGNMPENAGM